MPNKLPADTESAIDILLGSGMSARRVAAVLGLAHTTVQRRVPLDGGTAVDALGRPVARRRAVTA